MAGARSAWGIRVFTHYTIIILSRSVVTMATATACEMLFSVVGESSQV